MARYSDNYSGYAPYVSVAQRRANAAKEVAKLKKKGKTITPVEISGRKIATSFWGKAWCDHLESYSDYANRLPRGRTYARNGSVVHLGIRNGEIEALVSGSSIYQISITIIPVANAKWQTLCKQCAGGIGSLVELLQAKLSDSVMTHISHRESGLFPAPREIKMKCSCPDGAGLCKHLAAVLYGVGSRLDHQPELLFQLRSVDSADLISQATDASLLQSTTPADGTPELDDNDLSGIFGIEIDAAPTAKSKPVPARKATAKKVGKKDATKKVTAKPVVQEKAHVKKATPKRATQKKTIPKKATPNKAAIKNARRTETAIKTAAKKPKNESAAKASVRQRPSK